MLRVTQQEGSRRSGPKHTWWCPSPAKDTAKTLRGGGARPLVAAREEGGEGGRLPNAAGAAETEQRGVWASCGRRMPESGAWMKRATAAGAAEREGENENGI